MENVEIVGAGIGGLTLALALHRSGIASTVYERSSDPTDAGTGIILALNAMQVLDRLGLREAIEGASAHCAAMDVTDAKLAPLSRIDLAGHETKFATTARAIHRADLQRLLIQALPADTVRYGHEVVDISIADDRALLQFAGGEKLETSCLIGADGIGSRIREQCLIHNEIVPSGQTCWRGVAPFKLPSNLTGRLTEVWGRSGRLGFVEVSAGRVYWYIVARTDAPQGFQAVRTELSGANPWIADLLPTGVDASAHRSELADLKLQGSWQRGPVCLIGDAAHAVTPNLGQGGCQAIEDAWVLSRTLAREQDARTAFADFYETRRRKVSDVARRSRLLGQLSHWTNPLASAARNRVMRMLPGAANDAFLTRLYTLELD